MTQRKNEKSVTALTLGLVKPHLGCNYLCLSVTSQIYILNLFAHVCIVFIVKFKVSVLTDI